MRRLTQWSIFQSSVEYSWSFLPAEHDLEGSFEIVTNQACGLLDSCGGASTPIDPIAPHLRGVGSLFHVKYHPGQNDPIPGTGKLHWIQMVQANYGGFFVGLPVVKIDNFSRSDTPYYDSPGYRFAGEDFFMDRPYKGSRATARTNLYFNAQLYLVEEITPPESKKREVKIYNGIRWGWKSQAKRRSCDVSSSDIDNIDGECVVTKKFSDSLSSGTETDTFYLNQLTPGATFHAWINNDLPSNQCNPNTYLSGYNDNGYFLGADDNSSHLGNGFASSVLGTVSNNGTINLSVNAADGGNL